MLTFANVDEGFELVVQFESSEITTVKYKVVLNDPNETDPDVGGTLSALESNNEFQSGSAIAGTEIELEATVETGWEIEKWTVSSETQLDSDDEIYTENTLEYTVPETAAGTVSIQVHLIQTFYDVTFDETATAEDTAEAQSFGITSPAEVRGGRTVTFTPAVRTGYTHIGWLVNTEEDDTAAPLELVIEETVAVKARYEAGALSIVFGKDEHSASIAAYNVTQESDIGSGGEVTAGDTVRFTAAPADDYILGAWSVVVSGTGQPVAFTQSGNSITVQNVVTPITVMATSLPGPTMPVTVSYSVTGSGGNLTAASGAADVSTGGTISAGSEVTFTATPAQGMMVDAWTVTGVTEDEYTETYTETTSTIVIEELYSDVTASVSFKDSLFYGLNTGITGDGSLKVAFGEKVFDSSTNPAMTQQTLSVPMADNEVTFTATPDEGQMVATWYIDGQKIDAPNGNTFTHTLVKPETLVAVEFAAHKTYTAQVTANRGAGSIKSILYNCVSDGDNEVHAGGSVVFTVKSDEGRIISTYKLTDATAGTVGEAVQNENGSYDITVSDIKGDVTLEVGFVVALPVTFTAGPNGKLTATVDGLPITSGQIVPQGKTIVITITPDSGYETDKLNVNWPITPGENTFTLGSLQNAFVASVTFIKLGGGGGTGGGTGPAPVEPESKYELRSQRLENATGLPYYLEDGKRVYEAMSYIDVDGLLWYFADTSKEYRFAANPVSFTDIDGHWGEDEILFAAQREIFLGMEDDCFAPELEFSRAMMTGIIARLARADLECITTSDFDDVDDGKWYTPYIEWAAKEGLVLGTGGNKFEPNRPITRAEMAAIIDRFIIYMGYELPKGEGTPFMDISTCFAEESIVRLNQYGLINGYSRHIMPLKMFLRVQKMLQ